jgi:hypothetical protein
MTALAAQVSLSLFVPVAALPLPRLEEPLKDHLRKHAIL